MIDEVRDSVGLYLNPQHAAVVRCVDEQWQNRALDSSALVMRLQPEVPERHTHDYVRNGVTILYGVLDVASDQLISDVTRRHRAAECRRYRNRLDSSVPEHLDVDVVLDTSATHKTASLQRWLRRA